jgi:cell division septum initiation protein DivIVA
VTEHLSHGSVTAGSNGRSRQGTDLAEQLARLRRAIASARSMPMSASAVINRDDVLAMIDRLAAELPAAFTAADKVIAERDALVAAGREHAEAISAAARADRDRLLADTDVVSAARLEAEQIVADARREAEELRRETDGYVDTKLATFEISLTKTLQAVTRGRERLRGRSDLDALGADPESDVGAPGHDL